MNNGISPAKELTNEEKCVKIAEVCPFVQWSGPADNRIPFWRFQGRHPDFDPFNDLNAMHEAEKIIRTDDFKWGMYMARLADIVDDRVHSIARQRAEAFGKTLRLW